MKSKTMVLMAVAVVCGLGASYMTSRLLAERNETTTVLLPKQKYTQWTHIKDPTTMFEEREIPRNEAPKTAVAKFDDLKDRVLLRSLPEGQPVVQEDLQPKDKGSLDTQLPAGKRAVAIKVDATKSAGGFVLPGARVDVLHAWRHGETNEAKIILQNILVRAVDLQSVKPEDKQGVVGGTVTLEVTPQEALLLARVQDHGSLSLSLRSVGDSTEVTGQDTATAAAPKIAPPPPPPPLPPATQVAKKEPDKIERKTLTIYNGPHWTQANFITRNGQTTTEIVSSQQPVPANRPAEERPAAAGQGTALAEAPKSPEQILGAAEKALRDAERDLKNMRPGAGSAGTGSDNR
jgi:Flp pilus assembly protein CpaB